MRVLVTGASGFLGQAIITALQEAYPEWTLYNLDIFPPRTPQRNVTHVQADITLPSQLETAFQSCDPDAVIHTAGWVPKGSLRYSNSPALREKVFSINHTGTLNVLSMCKKLRSCKALVYTSSCTVISDDLDHDYANMTEDLPTGNATLSYGASKAPAEKAVLAANDPPAGLATCALRPATIIGPGDTYGVVATIHACIANRETPYIIGSGDNMYDFVYITNVADAHVLALQNLLFLAPEKDPGFSSPDSFLSPQHRGKETEQTTHLHRPITAAKTATAAGQTFFISNQQPIYFRDFMLSIWSHFNHHPPFQLQIPTPMAWAAGAVAEFTSWVRGARDTTLSRGSVRDAVGTRYASNEKARRVLGYFPRVDFVDAVRLACEDYKRILAAENDMIQKEKPSS